MLTIRVKNKKYRLPESWAEVAESGKFTQLTKSLMQHPTGVNGRVHALAALAGLDGYELGKLLSAATAAQRKAAEPPLLFFLQILEEVLPSLNFIFGKPEWLPDEEDKDEDTDEIKYKQLLTVNPQPEFKVNGIVYRSCGNRLYDQLVEEMVVSNNYLHYYSTTGQERFLNCLVAANYHRVTKGSRTAYDKLQFDADTEILGKALTPEQKHGVLIWYRDCEEWWSTQPEFDSIFRSTGEAAEADGKEWLRLAIELSGSKIGTDYEVLMKQERQIVFTLLAELEKKREAMEQQLQATRNA